jgi:XTP/dITP diphosphohydrolase
MVRILSQGIPSVEILTLADFPGAPEPEETGTTYPENAAIKARSGCAFTGEWCLADDAGLEVTALDGAPGVYSKRFGGEELPFPEKIALLLSRIEGAVDRSARFVCAVVLAGPEGTEELFQATCEGKISESPSGTGGFGYDPVFFLPQLNCTMADLTAEEKAAVSHRGKVLRSVIDRLTQEQIDPLI